MKVEICRGNKQCDLLGKKKVLRVLVPLGCGVCPHEWVGLVFCDVLLVGGACSCTLVDGAGYRLSQGQCSVQ